LAEKTQKTDQTFAWGEQAKHKNLMRENDTKETFHEIQPIGRVFFQQTCKMQNQAAKRCVF
jgi:hypothetical protein